MAKENRREKRAKKSTVKLPDCAEVEAMQMDREESEEDASAHEFIDAIYHLIDSIDDGVMAVVNWLWPKERVMCCECIYWCHRDISGNRERLDLSHPESSLTTARCERHPFGIMKSCSDACFEGKKVEW